MRDTPPSERSSASPGAEPKRGAAGEKRELVLFDFGAGAAENDKTFLRWIEWNVAARSVV
jgi:hypothetical protein